MLFFCYYHAYSAMVFSGSHRKDRASRGRVGGGGDKARAVTKEARKVLYSMCLVCIHYVMRMNFRTVLYRTVPYCTVLYCNYCSQDRYRPSPFDTGIFFLQNRLGAEKWPLTPEVLNHYKLEMFIYSYYINPINIYIILC